MTADQTPDEFMKELFPGSKTFPVKLLCPNCGWHFKHGLTDLEGVSGKLEPGVVLVCGQCLRMLRVNDQLQFAVLSEDEYKALPEEVRAVLVASWHIAMMTLLAAGPEPRGTKQ